LEISPERRPPVAGVRASSNRALAGCKEIMGLQHFNPFPSYLDSPHLTFEKC